MLIDLYFSLQIVGLNTNIRFLDDLASHPQFVAGDVNTGFIDEFYDELFPTRTLAETVLCQGALAMVTMEAQASRATAMASNGTDISVKTFSFLLGDF